MNNGSCSLNPSVNMTIEGGNASFFNLVDNLYITESIKKEYLIPYLSTLWDCLASESADKSREVHRFAFLKVFSLKINVFLVYESPRNYRRKNVWNF